MKNMIDKFVNMCELISVNENGNFFFPFQDVEHSNEITTIYADVDYFTLKDKMNKLISIINEDQTLVEKDIETELWIIL